MDSFWVEQELRQLVDKNSNDDQNKSTSTDRKSVILENNTDNQNKFDREELKKQILNEMNIQPTLGFSQDVRQLYDKNKLPQWAQTQNQDQSDEDSFDEIEIQEKINANQDSIQESIRDMQDTVCEIEESKGNYYQENTQTESQMPENSFLNKNFKNLEEQNSHSPLQGRSMTSSFLEVKRKTSDVKVKNQLKYQENDLNEQYQQKDASQIVSNQCLEFDDSGDNICVSGIDLQMDYKNIQDDNRQIDNNIFQKVILDEIKNDETSIKFQEDISKKLNQIQKNISIFDQKYEHKEFNHKDLDIFESEASRNLDCSNVNDDSIFDRSSNILLVDRSQLVPRNVINRIFDDDIKADSGKFLKSPLKEQTNLKIILEESQITKAESDKKKSPVNNINSVEDDENLKEYYEIDQIIASNQNGIKQLDLTNKNKNSEQIKDPKQNLEFTSQTNKQQTRNDTNISNLTNFSMMNKDSNLFEKTITNDDSIDDDDFISADDSNDEGQANTSQYQTTFHSMKHDIPNMWEENNMAQMKLSNSIMIEDDQQINDNKLKQNKSEQINQDILDNIQSEKFINQLKNLEINDQKQQEIFKNAEDSLNIIISQIENFQNLYEQLDDKSILNQKKMILKQKLKDIFSEEDIIKEQQKNLLEIYSKLLIKEVKDALNKN